MKKKLVLFSAINLVFCGALAFVLLKGVDSSHSIKGTQFEEYQITLNESNAPALENDYGREGEATVVSKGDYTLNMKYRLAKHEDGNHVTLAPHGFMYNEVDDSTYANRVTGLESIQVTYTSTSSIFIRTSIRNDGKEFGEPLELVSGTPMVFEDKPYYFMIEAGDAAAQISSMVLSYSCSENNGFYVSDFAGEYTGYGNDGYAYKLVIEGTSARLTSINRPDAQDMTGTVEINGNKATCTFEMYSMVGHYTVEISEDHRVLSYYSKDGIASNFIEIDFYKVYKVEDFERYTAQGQGFGGKVNNVQRGADSLYEMSGLGADWHADWYTKNSLPLSFYGANSSGYDWKVMGSSDFLTFTSTKGHNGTKGAAFKGNTNGLRYVQMKAPLGLPNIIGKGSYLSFWAKPYSDASLSNVKAGDTSIKVNAFYNQNVTISNIGTKTETDVTILGGSDWTRYVVPLDETKEYYSFGFYDNKSSQVYLAVDDVEIYTVDPYNPVAYDLSKLYIRGTAVSGWDVDEAYKLSAPSNPDNDIAEIINVHLKAGDFKIADELYKKEWNWNNFVGGSAKANFEAGSSNNNIHCNIEGDYDIYLTKDNSIYIDINTSALYIRGTAVGSWDIDNSYKLVASSDQSNIGEILNVHLKEGDFKIANAQWEVSWGYLYQNSDEWEPHVTVQGGAKDNFSPSGSDNNIHCDVENFYNIYLTKNNYIYIELAPAPYPSGVFKGTVSTTVMGDYSITIAFGNQENGLIAVRLANADGEATNVSYNTSTTEFEITTTGSYMSLSFGTISGKYDYLNDELTEVSCSGTISEYVANNGQITAPRLETWNCDGTTEELQQIFKRRYGDPWTVDTINADKIVSNREQFVSGTGSLNLRSWNSGRYALNFLKDFDPAISVQNVQFWVYNPSGSDISLRLFYYESTDMSGHGEAGSVTAKAGQWTYCAMGFGNNKNNRTIYNFQIADFTKSNVRLSFDDISLF